MSEDGSKLWLRYAPVGVLAESYQKTIRKVVVEGKSKTCEIIRAEMKTALASLLGAAIPVDNSGVDESSVVVGTPGNSPIINELNFSSRLKSLGPEGFFIASVTAKDRRLIAIASNSEVGSLYGAFYFLRLLQTG